MRKIFLFIALFAAYLTNAQDAETLYKKANEQFESKLYRKAVETVSQAIELNPTSLEYRWLRVQSLMTSHAGEPEFTKALADLNVIKENENTEKLYRAIGNVENYLASYFDHDVHDFSQAKEHYNLSKSAFQAAKKVSGNNEYDYKIKDADTALNDLQAKK